MLPRPPVRRPCRTLGRCSTRHTTLIPHVLRSSISLLTVRLIPSQPAASRTTEAPPDPRLGRGLYTTKMARPKRRPTKKPTSNVSEHLDGNEAGQPSSAEAWKRMARDGGLNGIHLHDIRQLAALGFSLPRAKDVGLSGSNMKHLEFLMLRAIWTETTTTLATGHTTSSMKER